ncbi:MAG: M23 family metallopeptidase [Actinomycetota bacterium]
MRRLAAVACVQTAAVGGVLMALAFLSAPTARGQTSTPPAPTTAPPSTAPPASPPLAPTQPPAPAADPVTPAPTTTPGLPAPTAPPASPTASATAPPTLEVPFLERTPSRNTSMLVEMLLPLTEWGLPIEQILLEGMGRFPVAGYAHYSDDWLAARYKPTPHLHRGLDIFAALGTPVRSPDAGVITSVSDSYPGGKSVTMRVYDGTKYYFAHLSSRAWGLVVGQSVEVGSVLGYVGTTGNAQGGAPHVHLEVTREGGTVPPKPVVDGWLSEAEASSGDWMERKRIEIDVGRRLPACSNEPSTGPNVTLLQILDDPVELDLGGLACDAESIPLQDASLVDLLTSAPA